MQVARPASPTPQPAAAAAVTAGFTARPPSPPLVRRQGPAGPSPLRSVANDLSTEALSTSDRAAASQEGAPSSWPSAAAREAAYSSSPREPAAQVPAAVSGRLPPWLKGSYVRNGPGDLREMEHMFDGYGFLLRFDLDGASNSVTASHRFVDSEAWKHYRDTGKMRWREFATPPKYASLWEEAKHVCSTLLGALGLSDAVTDNASVNVVPLQDGSAVAMTETVRGTYRVDLASLQTLEQVRYSGDAIRGDLTTAHPQPMPDGSLVNLVSTVGSGFHLYRHPAGAFERRERIATVPHRHPLAPAWVHDFPATPNYAVIPEMPLYFNVAKLLFGGRSDAVFMDWRPQDGTTLHVVGLRDGSRRTFRAPPCFVFHWANAHESPDGRWLHIDACLYEDPQICNDLYLQPLRAGYAPGAAAGKAFLRRFSLDLQAPEGAEVAWQALAADEAASPPFDFPKVSPLVRGKPYRYAWAACSTRPTNAHNSVCKFDLQSGGVATWHEPGVLVGEPLFVPAPEATAEDDGVVLVVLIQADGTSALVVLDGSSLAEVARARLPSRLTTGFHGAFVPAAK